MNMTTNITNLVLCNNLIYTDYNYIVEDILKSDYNKCTIYNLLSNIHLNKQAIRLVLDTLDEGKSYDIFVDQHGQYLDHDSLVTEIIKSNNKHVNKYAINFLVHYNKISDRMLKLFYKHYKITPILFSKGELLRSIVNNRPDVLENYYLRIYAKWKINDSLFEHLITTYQYHELNNLGCNPFLTAKQFERLFNLDNKNIYADLAKNNSLTKEYINKLLELGYYQVYINLSKNPSISKEVMQYLLDKNDGNINCYLAKNPSLDKEIAAEILHHCPIVLKPIKS